MKIAWHVISNRWFSAVTGYALQTARALECLQYQNIFTTIPHSPAAKKAQHYGFAVETLPDFHWYRLPSIQTLKRGIASDLTITYGGPESFLLGASGKMDGSTLVRFRGADRDMQRDVWAWEQRLSHRHFSGLVTPNTLLAHKFQRVFPNSVVTIPYGVSEQDFFPVPKSPTADLRLCILGRLDPVKGHREFLPLFKQLLGELPHLKLVIVGEAANLTREQIATEARRLQIADDRLEWHAERIQDLNQFINQCDVGVICSLGSEVICRVGEEFLMAGKPVLVSGVGALNELVQEPLLGVSYDRTSPHAAIKIRTALQQWRQESPAVQEQRAARARQLFGLKAVSEQWQEWLQRIKV